MSRRPSGIDFCYLWLNCQVAEIASWVVVPLGVQGMVVAWDDPKQEEWTTNTLTFRVGEPGRNYSEEE